MTLVAASSAVGSDLIPAFDGQSAIVPVCAAADDIERTSKRKLTVSNVELAAVRAYGAHMILDRARTAFGPTVIRVNVTSVPRQRKAVAVATDGKAVTRYAVVTADRRDDHGILIRGGQIVGHDHATQAEARAAALTLIDTDVRYTALAVRATVSRDSGSADLVLIGRPEAPNTELTVEVTTSEPRAGAAQTAWVVRFDYHT